MASSDVIEVFIETLHGTAFELLVSPADTVVSIKSRISRLEGIPVSQQHLIWQCQELPDDSSLHECNVTDGATLKLVLGMRGGPINTRKASLEERPTLYDVAKYLDAKGDELGGFSAPRLRAVRMVVMRDGDKVHLYTMVDGATRSPSGLLSEDNTPRELSDEDSASESRRHRENMVTRQKVEQLQRKMRSCRLRKPEEQPKLIEALTAAYRNDHLSSLLPPQMYGGLSDEHSDEGHKAASGGVIQEAAPAEDATTDAEVQPPPLEYVLPPIRPRNTRRRETTAEGQSVPSASPPWYPFPPGNTRACFEKVRERILKREEAQRASGTGLPQLLLPPPGSSGRNSLTTRHWRSVWKSNDGGAQAPRQLPPPQSAGARSEATGARSEATGARSEATGARSEATGARSEATGARSEATGARSEATGAVPKRIEPKRIEPKRVEPKRVEPKRVEPKRVESTVGSPHGRSTTAFQGRCRKVLPPVGRQQQGCSCLHPECDRPPEQDMATAPLLEPLELDWADCDRPRTAPARFVRLSVLRSAIRPTVSSPCSPNKVRDADAASAAGAAAKMAEASGSSPLSAGSSPVSSGPLSPSPRASSPISSAALLLDPTGVDACRHDLATARRPPPPGGECGYHPGGTDGIRWALGDGGRRAVVPSPTRLRVAPLLRRVRPEMWPEYPNLSRWARVAADNEGDDRKTPPPSGAVPTSNGPSNGGSGNAAGSSTEADSAATGAAVPPEGGSTMTVSSAGGAASGGSLVAETPSSLTGPMASSGSSLALSVDVGTVSATEMSSGNGMVPIQLDEDSSSTSESKTDDATVDPLHPSPGKAKKKGKRCSWCNKKTGLASTYVCRCGSTFCATHRYAEEHACSHDYKTEGRYILQRNNPVVKAAKLPKI